MGLISIASFVPSSYFNTIILLSMCVTVPSFLARFVNVGHRMGLTVSAPVAVSFSLGHTIGIVCLAWLHAMFNLAWSSLSTKGVNEPVKPNTFLLFSLTSIGKKLCCLSS